MLGFPVYYLLILKGCDDGCTQAEHTEYLFVDQDGANEYCQDKEHCDNNIMTIVHRINHCISTICNMVIILSSKNILVLWQRQISITFQAAS